MEIRESITIDALIDDVFDALIHDVDAWSPTVSSREPVDDSYPADGSQFRTEIRHQGQGAGHVMGTLVMSQRPNAIVLRYAHTVGDVESGFMLDDRDGPTEVTLRSSIQARGWIGGFIYRLGASKIQPVIRRLAESELKALKAYCERGTTSV